MSWLGTYRITGINPEPWAIGPLGVKYAGPKRIPFVGENANLASYQKAVKQYFKDNYVCQPHDGMTEFEFYFWRRLDQYELASGKKHQRHVADATNMQKALEDALQGVLVTNDRNVRYITSCVVEQGPDVNPGIIILHKTINPENFWQGGPDWRKERAAAEAVPDLGNLL